MMRYREVGRCPQLDVSQDREDAKMPLPGHDSLGGPMPRGQKLFWTIIVGSVVATAAAIIALIQVDPGSSPWPHFWVSASSQAGKLAPVVIPRASSTSPFSYISDMRPSSKLRELVYPGPVKIYGSVYPKSISFYCDDGDLPAFPAVYRLTPNARRFEATVGMEAEWPSSYLAGVSVVGDGRTLLSFGVSVLKPKTVNVNVTGVHILTLECFAPGITSAASAANVEVAWGNARVTEAH
jgi:NPCBM/NEW2 domain